MVGSDIMIIKFNGANKPVLMDTKGVGHMLPANYASNNLELIAYDVSGPRKLVRFKRKMNLTSIEPHNFELVRGSK